MKKKLLSATISLFLTNIFFANRTHAQVNAATYEGTDGDLSKPAVVNNTFIGTIGRNPSVIDAPLPTDWWSVINIRHRNGGADGPLWGTQIAIGMT